MARAARAHATRGQPPSSSGNQKEAGKQHEESKTQVRAAAERLLVPHGATNDPQGQRAAIAYLYEALCPGPNVDLNAVLGPLRVDLLAPILVHVNDESAPRQLRIQACRVLTIVLGGAAPSLTRLFDAIDDDEEEEGNRNDDGGGKPEARDEREEDINKVAAKRRRQRATKAKPRANHKAQTAQAVGAEDRDKESRNRSTETWARLRVASGLKGRHGAKKRPRARAERKGLIGVLLGRDASHAKTEHDTRRFMGYEVPMVWYPKTSEALRERRLGPGTEASSDDVDARSELRLPPIAHVSKAKRALTPLEGVSGDELDRVLEEERALWRTIDEGIRARRLALPSHFLLEQGLEVAYSREIARRVLDRLFRYAGREPLRAPFRKWHAHTLELRFQEFARYASLEKIRQIIRRMLAYRMVRAWETWTAFVAHLQHQERCQAVVVFQKRYRGLVGRRAFAVHKERWYAARRVQTWLRMLRRKHVYAVFRAHVCVIQRYERMWAVQRMVVRWHAAAVPIQAMARMRPLYLWFCRVKAATLMIQANYRGVLGRVRFKRVFEEFALRAERQWPAAVRIQRCWHRHRAYCAVRAIHARELAINNAALRIQTQWYIYKEEFPAFIMMRVYMIQDKVDKIEARLEKRARRAEAARHGQRLMRGVFAQRLAARVRIEHHAAIRAQACARGFVARQRVARFRALVVGLRRVQALVRRYFAPRHAAASRIQREVRARILVLRGEGHHSAPPGPANPRARARASVVLQTRLARSAAAKTELARRRAARLLQRVARGHLGRCRARACAILARQNAARAYVGQFLAAMHADMSRRIYTRRNEAARRVQRWYKECKARFHAKALRKWHARRTRGARTIQRIVRGVQGRRHLARDRELDRRVRTNRYKGLEDPCEIARTAIMHARAFYDTADPLAGMHPCELLHRLGLAALWEPLHKGAFHVNDSGKLCSIPDKALRDFLRPYCEPAETAEEDLDELSALLSAMRASPAERAASPAHAWVMRRIAFVRDPSVAQRVFASVFPDQGTRADNFARKLPANTVTRAQLYRYMVKYRGRPKEAKDHVEAVLLAVPDADAVAKWNLRRFRQCTKVYEMALETIGKRVLTDELRLVVADALLRARRPDVKDARPGCDELRVALDLVIKLVTAAGKLQRAIRAKLARVIVRACLARKRYREELLEGGILKKNWQLQKEREAREYADYLEAMARYEVEQGLAEITRFGYLEVWDEYAQAYYYTDEHGAAQAVWERPVYTFEEDAAARKMQRAARSRGARRLRQCLEEAKRRHERELERQRAWEALAHERLNLVTFRFNLEEVTSADEAEAVPMFPSWRRKRASWAEALRTGNNAVEAAEEAVQAAVVAEAHALRAVATSQARRARGRDPGDRWYPVVRTGKREISFEEAGSQLAHWTSTLDEETGVLRFRCRFKDDLPVRSSLADLENAAMHNEDKAALALEAAAEGMRQEDEYSRQREAAEFVESRLLHILSFVADKNSTRSAYDLKVRLREEARAADRIAALVRGHLVRRERWEASLRAAQARATARLEAAQEALERAESVRARLHVPLRVRAAYTYVAMPLGWQAKRDGYGRTYYIHDASFETVWERPAYLWEHEVAAGSIQRVYRGWRGRVAFLEAVRSEGVCLVAERAIAKAASTACFEYPGGEGLSVEMWFARRGLHEIVRDVLAENRSIEKRMQQRFRSLVATQSLPWTKESLQWLGIKREDQVAAVMASEDRSVSSSSEEEALELVREPDDIEALFLSQYPTQAARALKFAAQAAQVSEMPITMRQLELHLEKYKGKPSLATVQLQDEVFNLPTTSAPADQEAAFYILLGAVRRIMIIAANMKLDKLHGELRHLSQRASGLLSEPEEGRSPGPWLCRRTWPREAMAAYEIRVTLERALTWEKMAVRVQRVYRDYRNLMQWREIAAWYRRNITTVQCAWRQYAARKLARLRHEQFHSFWEELYDPHEDIMYYFDNRTEKSQWHRPREPYKPFGWWPPHPDDIPVPEGKCFVCRQEEAVRICEECVTKNGVNRAFCFDCFAEVHGSGGAAFARHAFRAADAAEQTAADGAPGLICNQCQGPGIRRCDDCGDFYCLACFRRLHARGRRREHAWTAFTAGCPVCVECERQVAAVYCESCRDHLCSKCSTRVHGKGRRKQHVRVDLPSYETKTGQGL